MEQANPRTPESNTPELYDKSRVVELTREEFDLLDSSAADGEPWTGFLEAHDLQPNSAYEFRITEPDGTTEVGVYSTDVDQLVDGAIVPGDRLTRLREASAQLLSDHESASFDHEAAERARDLLETEPVPEQVFEELGEEALDLAEVDKPEGEVDTTAIDAEYAFQVERIFDGTRQLYERAQDRVEEEAGDIDASLVKIAETLSEAARTLRHGLDRLQDGAYNVQDVHRQLMRTSEDYIQTSRNEAKTLAMSDLGALRSRVGRHRESVGAFMADLERMHDDHAGVVAEKTRGAEIPAGTAREVLENGPLKDLQGELRKVQEDITTREKAAEGVFSAIAEVLRQSDELEAAMRYGQARTESLVSLVQNLEDIARRSTTLVGVRDSLASSAAIAQRAFDRGSVGL